MLRRVPAFALVILRSGWHGSRWFFAGNVVMLLRLPTLYTVAAIALMAGACARPQPADLAVGGVTVVDVTDGSLRANQTVLIEGDRIVAVGPANKVRASAGAELVEAAGKYLIPGLWDMHALLFNHGDRAGIDLHGRCHSSLPMASPAYAICGPTRRTSPRLGPGMKRATGGTFQHHTSNGPARSWMAPNRSILALEASALRRKHGARSRNSRPEMGALTLTSYWPMSSRCISRSIGRSKSSADRA